VPRDTYSGCVLVVTGSSVDEEMEKYRLVEEHKGDDGDEFLGDQGTSEVRITQQGKPRNYISYAMSLFVSLCIGFNCTHLLIHYVSFWNNATVVV
jgi:hypothetical protein